jgi:hypothetical protein
MADSEAELFTAPLHAAAARSRMAEQGPHVRGQGWPSSARPPFGEHQGQSRQHDVAETGMPGAMALVTFPERKVTRSPQRRAETSRMRHTLAQREELPS